VAGVRCSRAAPFVEATVVTGAPLVFAAVSAGGLRALAGLGVLGAGVVSARPPSIFSMRRSF
jgi:hypothetical protein